MPDEAEELWHFVERALKRRGESVPLESGFLGRSLLDHAWDRIGQEPAWAIVVNQTNLKERVEHARSINDPNHHIHSLNPFHFQDKWQTVLLLNAFLNRINSTFFFFKDEELKASLDTAYNGSIISNQMMYELCLALALGAQWHDGISEDTAVLWYENGRRYLDGECWDHEARLLRVMGLISLYHISTRPGTAQHYLSMSYSLCVWSGHANKLWLG